MVLLRLLSRLSPVEHHPSRSDSAARRLLGTPMLPIIVLITLLATFLVTAPGQATAQSPIEAARASVEAVQIQLDSIELDMAAAQGRADAATARFWKAQERAWTTEALIEGKVADLTVLDAELDAAQIAFEAEVVNLYVADELHSPVNSAQDHLDQLTAVALAGFVGADSANVIDYYTRLTADRQQSVDELEVLLGEQSDFAAEAASLGQDLTAELAEVDGRRQAMRTELAALVGELERLEAEEAARVEAERIAAEKAEAERLAAERAEAERLAAELAEAERLAVERAAAENAAAEQAEAERLAAELAEAERVAAELAEAERLAAELTEAQRLAAELLEADRAAAELTDAERVAAEVAASQLAAAAALTDANALAPAPTARTALSDIDLAPTVPAAVVPSGGAMLCPLLGPFTHIDDFGAPRPQGAHEGNDLMAAFGTPIVAMAGGELEHRTGGLGGLTARIRTDGGGWHYYAHMSAYENEGAGRVSAGTVIGYVGNSGDASATPPHLHLEIHSGGYGYPDNPYFTVVNVC